MKNLPNTSKEQRTATVSFLGQYLANSFNTEVIEYKKSHLLFIFNKRQIVVSVAVSDPPFTTPVTTQTTFTPKPYYQDLTKFDINEKESEYQEKNKELKEREEEVSQLMDKMSALKKELEEKEKLLKEREEEFNQCKAELDNSKNELNKSKEELDNNKIELNNSRTQLMEQQSQITNPDDSHLKEKEARLDKKMTELEEKEVQLNTSKKQLREKEEVINNKEVQLKVKEVQLNNQINDSLLRQDELNTKEKELAKIKEILDTTRQNLTEREKEIEIKEQQFNKVDDTDERDPLESPILNIEMINNIPYLKWKPIEYADNYSIDYAFNSKPVDTTSIDFDVHVTVDFIIVNLAPFTESGVYEFSITAIADEENEFKNSLPSKPITHFVFNEEENN